jgi:hypothetical protein
VARNPSERDWSASRKASGTGLAFSRSIGPFACSGQKDASPAWGRRGGLGFTKSARRKPTMLVRPAAETLFWKYIFYGHYGISEPRRFRGNAQ